MKFISFIIISVSVCLGLVSAMMAYLPSLDLADDELIGLTLNAPAGKLVILESDRDLYDAANAAALTFFTRARSEWKKTADEVKAVEEEASSGDPEVLEAAKEKIAAVKEAGAATIKRLRQEAIDGHPALAALLVPEPGTEPEAEASENPVRLRRVWIAERLTNAFMGLRYSDSQLERNDDADVAEELMTAAIVFNEDGGFVSVSGATLPLVEANTQLTSVGLGLIRANLERPGVSISESPSDYRVRVKEFTLARWEGKWFFLASCVGLVVGAGIVRASAASALATPGEHDDPSESPMQALSRAHDDIVALRTRLESMGHSQEALSLITHELDRIAQTHFEPFVEARPALVGALGMGGYARLMDVFAGAERQLNRAWSAAADNVPEESLTCLGRGVLKLEDAVKLLPKQK